MRITIHRGIDQASGCITEIATEQARILIDLGQNHPDGDGYSHFLQLAVWWCILCLIVRITESSDYADFTEKEFLLSRIALFSVQYLNPSNP